jgi:hypothetical protein
LRRGLENAGFAATEIAIGDYFPDEELFFATIGHRSGQIAEVIFDELGSLEIGGVRRLDDLAERGLVGREAWAALEVLRFDEILEVDSLDVLVDFVTRTSALEGHHPGDPRSFFAASAMDRLRLEHGEVALVYCSRQGGFGEPHTVIGIYVNHEGLASEVSINLDDLNAGPAMTVRTIENEEKGSLLGPLLPAGVRFLKRRR